MIFKEFVYVNGEYIFRTSSRTKFNSYTSKQDGYVLRVKEDNGNTFVDIVFAFEMNGSEDDDSYTLLTKETAMNIVRTELLKLKRKEKADIDKYYDDLILSLVKV